MEMQSDRNLEHFGKIDQGIPAPAVVAVGSSAGGIEELLNLIRGIPQSSRQAVLICQHVAPGFNSILHEILTRHSSHRVLQATDGALLSSGTFYLMPPGFFLTVCNGRVWLRERTVSDPRCFFPIDQLFKSLAVGYGKRAIAIVLSGTGTDGTQGVLEIRKRGGHVLIQDVATAAFQGMLRGVKDSNVAYDELPISAMPERIELITKNLPFQPSDRSCLVDRILMEIFCRLDLDFFSADKANVTAKITRRAAILGITNLKPYFNLVKKNPAELVSLGKSLQAEMAEFSYENDVHHQLQKTLFPLIVDQCLRNQEKTARFWILGGSTGVETYALAFRFQDFLEEHKIDLSFKIFSTDSNEAAISIASRGLYSHNQVARLPQRWLEKYFSLEGSHVAVAKELRENTAFLAHDFFKDPPFPSIHFVYCRKLPSFIKQGTKEKLISLVEVSLKNGGFLLSGSRDQFESIRDCYEIFDEQSLVYRVKPLAVTSEAIPDGYRSYEIQSLQDQVVKLEVDLDKKISELEDSIKLHESNHKLMRTDNDQLQAVIQAVKSSNQELQAINQELQVMNTEAQLRIKELTETNSDLNTVFKTSKIGTMIIGQDGMIMKFNRFLQKAFHLVSSDVGRPIQDFSGVLPPVFCDNLRKIIENHRDVQVEMLSHDDVLYIVRMSPYRNKSLVVEGVIVILIDISYLKNRLSELTSIKRDYEIICKMSPHLVVKLALNGAVLEGNAQCENLFQIGDYPYFGFLQSMVPEDRRMFEEKIVHQKKHQGVCSSLQVRHQVSLGTMTSICWSLESNSRLDGQVSHIVAVGRMVD